MKDTLTPKAIVAALDAHIIGQKDAKRAVAVALRNRWRRQRLSPDLRAKDLTDSDVAKLREYIEASVQVEGDLRREVQGDIRRKIEIGCYQGLRHRRGLPVRGQRTKTNARTRKGPRGAMIKKKK